MRFDLTDEQWAVRDAVDELCRSRWNGRVLRDFVVGDDDGDTLWNALSAAGWTGAAVAERYGGQDLGAVELSLVCEGLGRALAPGTFFGNTAAAILVATMGTEAQQRRWLPGFASGEARGALAEARPDGSAIAYDAAGAAAIVLLSPAGASIADIADVSLDLVDGLDLTRRLHRVSAVRTETLTGDPGAAVDRLEVALAAELVGVGARALELAVAHARGREQFGRPIGTNQAVSHRCADMLLDVESARSAVLFAAWCADNDPAALPLAASVAKVAAAQGAWRATASALQVHGGIGFTWDHDCHLLLRRAATSGRLLGSVDAHLERVAALRGLGPDSAGRPGPG